MNESPTPRMEIHGRLLARNTVLNVAGQAAPLVVALLCMPPVIAGLGKERFGLLALTWVVLGYFNVFDLGLGRATTKFVAEALGRGEAGRVPPLVWTAAITQALLGVIAALAVVLLTPVLVEHVLNIPANLQDEARLSFCLLGVSIPAVLVMGSFRGALEAAQRFDLVNALRVPFSAAAFFLPLVAVWAGWKLPGAVGLLVISRGLALLMHIWVCQRVFPNLAGSPILERSLLRTLVGFGGWVAVSSAVGPILVYLDRFLLGVLLTLGAVTYYSAPYEMVSRLWILPASLAMSLFPAFSTLSASQPQRLEALATRSVKYILFFLGPVVVVLVAIAPNVLRIWLGADFEAQSTRPLQILSIGVLVNSLAVIPFSLLQAVGRPDLPAKFHLLELPVHAVLAWSFIYFWGINGAALAWTIRVTLDALLLFGACWRLSLVSSSSLVANRALQTAALVALAVIVVAGAGAALPSPGYRGGLVAMVVLGMVATAWRYSLNDAERGQLLSLLGRASPK